MKKLNTNLKQILIFFLLISVVGCEENDPILPDVVAGFTQTANQETGTVKFINISEFATKYNWTFGDGETSTEINPIKTYATGTYTVVLKASNPAGASATFEDEIYINIPEPISLPITFDNDNVAYDATSFSGASFAIIDNPDVSGTNNKASKVGEITNSGAAYEGFSFNFEEGIDLTTLKSIRFNFFASAPIDLLLKLEKGTAADTEVTVSHGGTGWEELTFSFSSSATYDRFTLFVDGTGTTAGTFHMDDIVQIETPIPTCEETMLTLPVDFECAGTDYASKDSGDVAFEIIDNPELSGINATPSKVAKLVFDSNQQWENMNLKFDTPIDFSTDKTIKFKFFSADARTLKLKLEGGGAVTETDVNHTGSGWEELTFVMDTADSYTNLVLFVDGGENTVGTFYIDDLILVASTGGTACTETTLVLPIDFDCEGIDYASKDSGDVAFEVIDNPELTGINATPSKVAKLVFDSNQQWENMNLKFDTPIDFSTDKFITMKFYSTDTRALKLKFEGGGAVTETDVNHTGSGWEELSFEMNTSDSYTNLVLFVDGGTDTAGTFYVDDLMQAATGANTPCTETTLALPINFDCEGVDYASKDSGDVAFEVIDNPELTGINATPSKVGKLVFDSNQQWENMNLKFDTPIDFSTDKTIKFKFYSADARTLKLKFEGGGAASEKDVNHTGSGWEELTFVMNTASSYTNLVLFVDGGMDTAGTFYIDDIVQIAATGGSDCPTPVAGELIPNGDFEAGEGCWQLIDNGGTTTISSTVHNGGSKSGQIKTAPLKNPGLKQTRFAVGTALANTEYKVTFDIKADAATPLVDGAVFQAFIFSEGADGGGVGAIKHDLVLGLGNVSTTWETKTFTFTSGAAPENVAGGFSFLAELVCGGAATCDGLINIDNVSIKVNK